MEGLPTRHIVVSVVLAIIAFALLFSGGAQSPNQDVVRAVYTAASAIVFALIAVIWVED